MSHAHDVPPAGDVEVTSPGATTFASAVAQTGPDRATIELQGEMDLATTDLVIAVLDHALALGRRYVCLDLSRLTFMDCAALRLVVDAHNRFLGAGGALVLTGVGPRVARLLSITHLDEALFVTDTPARSRPARRHLKSVTSS